MNPLAPQHVLFFVALAAALLLMMINALGGVDHDTEHDHDVDHEGDDLFGRAISVLGIGRAPVMLVLLIFFGIFGVTGIFLSMLLTALPVVLAGVISHVTALVVAIFGTSFITSRVAKVMPKTESYNVSKEHLVGCLGTAVYTVDATSGAVQVRDSGGDIYKIPARTSRGESIPMGCEIVVVSYDDTSSTFTVTSTK